ncbi:hypothetical protein BK138_19105 [Paenibacillus rhizosphaerae]|uniref:Uncharacterized protein n=1 Tax=Paenibacillus rhizosphaerae TaxID=297318 RepID=A0A1R1EMJ1_9BACL|nr:hypothetical protein [Paenibacillus rhizosphaerae]OMF53025.1 hypothetical protein BK138_19105 [Paenibacillus rhizosphaerae]
MNDFKTLILLDRCKGLFEKAGMDYVQMRRILQVKLTMDGRRAPTLIGKTSRSADPDELSNQFLKSLWIYAVMGAVMTPFVVMGHNLIFQMSIVFGILMFMITTSMISDFSSVLLDVRDHTILGSKPVNAKTINMAKAIHIMIYLFFITGSITAAPLVGVLFRYGILFFLVFVLEIVLMDLLIVAITALLYWLVLRFFDGEKLKDIINYVQIGLTMVMAVGYQLIARVFNLVDLQIGYEAQWWHVFLFPVWFAAPFEWLFGGHRGEAIIVFSLLSVLLPLLAVWIYVRMIPSFEANLRKLSTQTARKKGRGGRWPDVLGRWICRSREEQVFFRFALGMIRKERDYKLKVYPSLGLSLIFPFIFMFNTFNSGSSWEEIRAGNSYLFMYFCAVMIPSAVMMLQYTSTPKGAWIFNTVPLRNHEPVYKGTLKACIAQLILPIFVVESMIFTVIFGVRILPDLLVILVMTLLYTVISFRLMGLEMPFTEPAQAGTQSGRTGLMLLLFLILGAMAGLHFALRFSTYGVYVLMAVALIANIAAWKLAFRNL